MGCKVPRRSRNEISFGCKCSKLYSEWNLHCKQFIVPTFDTKVTEYLCSGCVFFFRQVSTF